MSDDPNIYPPGLDRETVERIIAYYENQTEEEAVAEYEASLNPEGMTMLQVPSDMVPLILRLIESRRGAN